MSLLIVSRALIFRNLESRPFCKYLSNMSEASLAKKISEQESAPEPEAVEAKRIKLDEQNSVKQFTAAEIDKRRKRKKYAMCLTYSGKGYFGMQVNQGVKTIEGEFFDACLKAGYTTEDHASSPQLINFQRAARTDKGVSAVRQVVSLKMPTEGETPEQMVKAINSHLVDQIRVVAMKRVTKNFDAKNSADSRSYLYVCPSYAFAPKTVKNVDNTFRMPEETVTEINRILNFYVGTHNFHNFTSGRKYNERSAMRHMIKIECSSPFMVGDTEYVQIRIKGQSFMLHQIRKMVGVVIGIVKGYCDDQLIARCFIAKEKLDLPVAPALGLLLETVHYEFYNRRFGGDGQHEPIEWDEHQPMVNKFKEEFILPNIWETEKEEKSMLSWLETLPNHSFEERRFEERNGPVDEGPDVAEDVPEEDDADDDDVVTKESS